MIMEDEELKYFSKKMCQAIEEQTDINNALTNKIQNSLQKDVTTQNEIKSIIDKHVVYKLGLWMPVLLTAIIQLVVYYLK